MVATVAMGVLGTRESDKDDLAPMPVPKSPEANFLRSRPRTDSDRRGPAKLSPMFQQLKSSPIPLQAELPHMLEGVPLLRPREHFAQSVIIDRPFSRSQRARRSVLRERTWSDDSWKNHQQAEDDQSSQISDMFEVITKFAADSLFSSPPSPRRRVRFQVTKAENCTIEICPYSEIYGMHPAFFEFGPTGEMLPPAKAQSSAPTHRFSLGASAEEIIRVGKMGSQPMEEWFATSSGSMTPLAQALFQQGKLKDDGDETTDVPKPAAHYAPVLLGRKAALDAAVPDGAGAVKEREFIAGGDIVGAIACPGSAPKPAFWAPASAQEVRDFKRAVEIDRRQDRSLFRTARAA